MIEQLAFISIAVFVYISIVYIIAISLKRFDIVDIAWGGAFIVVALASFALAPRIGPLQLLVTGLVMVWGLRLAYHIFRRVQHSPSEDPRYAELRSEWKGNVTLNAYLRIFLVQGILATIVSASVIIINFSGETSLGWIAAIGVIVWLVGFLFESIGDAQLKRHLVTPSKKGELMTGGLWQYTRHPNYFGEAMQWWGIWTIAVSVPFGWAGVISPLVITFLLLFVSGVPLTEKRFRGRQGWTEYKKRTSRFIPLPPKKA